MSAYDYHDCPLCKGKNSVRDDRDIGLNDAGELYVDIRMECNSCGSLWMIDTYIDKIGGR